MPHPYDPSVAAGAQRLDRRTLVKLFVGAFAAGAGLFNVIDAQGQTAASLAPEDGRLIDALADTILPDTDTPGALKAGVAGFIVTMVDEWFDPADRNGFLAGLRALDRDVRATSGVRFTELSPARRLMMLQQIQAQASAVRSLGGPVPFFLMFKRLVVYGYYTSEAGASEELTLNVVPGEYRPCAPVAPHEHAFSISRTWPLFPLTNAPSI